MFTNGLKHSGLLLMVAAPIGIIIGYLAAPEIGALTGYIIIAIGAIYYGYTYFPKYGPLFLSNDGSAVKQLFKYSMGFGVTFGIPYIGIVLPTLDGLNIIAMLLIACLAIPLIAMKFIGALALGRFFSI